MTVRIEYMLVNEYGSVLSNWSTCEGSVQNDPQVYVPRMFSVKYRYESGIGQKTRVRVVDEQTSRIVDMMS